MVVSESDIKSPSSPPQEAEITDLTSESDIKSPSSPPLEAEITDLTSESDIKSPSSPPLEAEITDLTSESDIKSPSSPPLEAEITDLTSESDIKSPSSPRLVELTIPVVVAKYDYSARTDGDLGFKRGDLLYIMNLDDEDWWLARAEYSGQEGYIPSNYVAEYQCELDAEM